MKTVLVIEDSTKIRENTCELLELEGYQVLSATNGKAGVALAKESKPDVIICDIWMPEANGYQVFLELKEDDHTSKIPFVFLTASAELKEVQKGLGLGAQGYISKPFEAQELFDTIERCFKES